MCLKINDESINSEAVATQDKNTNRRVLDSIVIPPINITIGVKIDRVNFFI